MVDATAGRALPQVQVSVPVRTVLWLIYQIVAIGALAAIVFGILGWRATSTEIQFMAAVTFLPQLATTYNLIRAGRPPPSVVLWLALVIVCAAALGVALWASTREVDEAILIGVASFAWAPAYLSMWFTPWASMDDRKWLVQGINLLSAAYVVLIAVLYVVAREGGIFVAEPWVIITLLGLAAAQPLIACTAQAFADKRLPVAPGGQPELKHISGVGAIFAVLFIASIAGLGIWAALGQNGFVIHREAGIVVTVGLALAFLLVAIAPNFQTSDRFIYWLRNTGLMRAFGGFVSTLDGILVFAGAGAVGTAQTNNGLRYMLLLANLVAAGLMGWWLPAPYGIIPIAWAFMSTLAVSRRWAWVEEDRENAMLNRRFEGPHIRVGFDQDLRDEALIGFTALLILVPLGLRQVHETLDSALFVIPNPADADNLLSWLTFFGTELAKAVPFVDWAEIYQVKGDAPIRVDEETVGTAQHVIFGTRVLVDLVLLATLVQAIAVAQRASKLREMFYDDRTINRLDPFVELKAFRQLVNGERNRWILVDPLPAPFRSYDEDRLEALQSRYESDAVGFAAREILRTQSAELLLVEEAKLENADALKMEEYLERLRTRSDDEIAIKDLRAAHFILNDKSRHAGVREQIIALVGDHWRAPHAVSALTDFLMGQTSRDTRAEGRLAALRGLYQPALNGDRSAQLGIRYSATHDPAAKVRDLAAAWIAANPDWGT